MVPCGSSLVTHVSRSPLPCEKRSAWGGGCDRFISQEKITLALRCSWETRALLARRDYYCNCLQCLPLYWKYVKQGLSRSITSSVGSGSSTVEFLITFSAQSRASWSGILVNSDCTSKATSLWSSGICIVLMASIKFSVDCSFCLDSSVSSFSTLGKFLDSW